MTDYGQAIFFAAGVVTGIGLILLAGLLAQMADDDIAEQQD